MWTIFAAVARARAEGADYGKVTASLRQGGRVEDGPREGIFVDITCPQKGAVCTPKTR